MIEISIPKQKEKSVNLEEIQLSHHGFKGTINVLGGIDEDIWVFICPSLNVTGYGKSKRIAMNSFSHNLEVFLEDLFRLKHAERIKYLIELGWHRSKYFQKSFSKSFIDKEGILQNLNLKTPEVFSLEAVA